MMTTSTMITCCSLPPSLTHCSHSVTLRKQQHASSSLHNTVSRMRLQPSYVICCYPGQVGT